MHSGFLNYVSRRLLLLVPTLLGITLVTFAVIRLAPGDPAAIQAAHATEPDVSQQDVERLRKVYGLDSPVPLQYLRWLFSVATLDFGQSLDDHRPVVERIAERLPATLSLTFFALLLALGIAIPIGVVAGVHQDKPFDRISSLVLYALYAVPSFAMALGLLFLFGVELRWLPLFGIRSDDFETLALPGKVLDLARHHLLPVLCLAYGSLAYYARFIRQSFLETVRQDYIRTARAKGLSERSVVWRHAFRNTLVPLTTLVGLLFPALVSGSLVLETLFSWPGIGRLLYDAVLSRDYPTIMGLSFLSALLVLVGTLLADIAYGLVDPRVTYE
ncbi:MAG: ABC transporter permease [Planctomycetota bacterium]